MFNKMMSKTSRLFVFTALTGLSLAGVAQADLLLGWDFSNVSPILGGAPGPVASTATDANMQAGSLTRGAAASGTNAINANFISATPILNTRRTLVPNLASAETQGLYFQFVATPTVGSMSLSSLSFVAYSQRGLSGDTVQAEYSLDGFSTAGTLIGSAFQLPGIGNNNSWLGTLFTVDLTGEAALQNVATSVTVRLLFYGVPQYEDRGLGWAQSTPAGSVVELNGSVIPEPATLGLMAIGGLLMIGRKR